MTVHLSGLGLIGSLVALQLEAKGIDFTWHDADSGKTAWKASTGCVFPTGDEQDMKNLQHWDAMLRRKDVFSSVVSRCVETAQWTYISKHPPHSGAKIGIKELGQVGPFHISDHRTLQFNVQRLVSKVRERYQELSVAEKPKDSILVVTHGSASAVRYQWGWSINASLKLSKELEDWQRQLERRLCLYLRQGYATRYLYPKPRTSLYYGGTSSVSQNFPRPLDAHEHLKKWLEKIPEVTEGHVEIVKYSEPTEGWRPVASELAPLVNSRGRVVALRPMAGNGVRSFPELGDALMQRLGKML